MKLSAICIATLFLLQAPFSSAQTAPVSAIADQALAARIDASIAPYFKPGEPGAAVIVTRDGKTIFRKAYGMADVAKQVPMTPDMALRIGSVTKQFTAAAILMLAEEGKLALSDDITKYLPDYPTGGKKVTIEHLLTHTSGITNYTSKPDFRGKMGQEHSLAQLIDSFKNDAFDFEPGTQWRYSNSGYILLGAIIEKVSGQSYAKFVEQRIFVPLGMNNTAYEGHQRGKVLSAAGHSPADGRYVTPTPVSMSMSYAAGALVSTVDDMARWDHAIATGALLKPASWQKAFTPYMLPNGSSSEYGYGWMFDKVQGAPVVWHGGRINGFKAGGWRLPTEKVYVAVLSNADNGVVAPELVAYKAAAIAIGKPFREFTPVALEPKAIEAFTGVYKIDDKSTRSFRADNGRLTMERTGRPVIALQPFSDNGFYVPNTLDHIEFSRNAKGEVVQLTYHAAGNATVQPRTGPVVERVVVKLAPAVLDTYVGRYQLSPNMHVDIRRDGERLFAQPAGQSPRELFASSDKQFFAREANIEVQFDKAADGEPQMTLSVNGRAMPGKRVSVQ
jgi:D-alanyl-D-alanine carboxypeptidase